jgi:transposase-like protein
MIGPGLWVGHCFVCNGQNGKALSDQSHPQPRVINTDLAPIYTSAIPATKKEGTLRRRFRHRPVQYWNDIIEQNHRAIKRRVPSRDSENSRPRDERFRVMK